MGFDINNAYDSLLAVTDSGCKSGKYVQLGFGSCWGCNEAYPSSFEDGVKQSYRQNADGSLSVAVVFACASQMNCSDYDFENTFRIFGLIFAFCIADDGCPALLFITPDCNTECDYTIGSAGDKWCMDRITVDGTEYDLTALYGSSICSDAPDTAWFDSWVNTNFGGTVTYTFQGGGLETVTISGTTNVFESVVPSDPLANGNNFVEDCGGAQPCNETEWVLYSKIPNPHPDFPSATFIGKAGAGSTHPTEGYNILNWNIFAICSETQPATDSNNHDWLPGVAGDYPSVNFDRVGEDPTCC